MQWRAKIMLREPALCRNGNGIAQLEEEDGRMSVAAGNQTAGNGATVNGVTGSEAAVGYAREQGTRFVEELKELLRIPSVSTAPEHVGDVRKAAEFVADGLRAAGMENVRLIETTSATHPGGHPLVYADWLQAEPSADGKAKPTVLLLRAL